MIKLEEDDTFKKRAKEIVLVEDNPGDVYLVRASLANSNFNHNFYHARDGEEIMAYLRQKDDYLDFPLPDLILLDLNLPKKSGFEVLTEIKTDPRLRTIPVVVLTSSFAKQDIILSYELYANSYIVKPAHYLDFFEAIKQLESFWLSLIELPPKSN